MVSGDRDLLQLATDHIQIRIPKTKRTGTEIEDYHTAEVVEKYQVTPVQIIDLKALMGDASDNIPGIPGVGEKTASKIIAAYGSIENAYAHVEEIKPNKAKESLKNHYDLHSSQRSWRRSTRTAPLILNWKKQGSENCIQRRLSSCASAWSLKIFCPDFSVRDRKIR